MPNRRENNGEQADDKGASREPSARKEQRTVERLERALEKETRTTAELRESVDALHDKLARMEANFETRLDAARLRSDRAEAKLLDQANRVIALGSGREDTMRQLGETRAELARVTAERDLLLKRLSAIESMQTETVALVDSEPEASTPPQQPLPTLDELMASLQSMEQVEPVDFVPEIGEAEIEPLEAEMIAPEVVFPEEYSKAPEALKASSEPDRSRTSRLLVFLDADPPIKYPLYKDTITLGRSEWADIRVDGDFISRVHARILATDGGAVIEDVASKNGIRVNSEYVDRRLLQHGDVIGLGKLRFTFIDTSAE
jgi:hypothetical protein